MSRFGNAVTIVFVVSLVFCPRIIVVALSACFLEPLVFLKASTYSKDDTDSDS